jgi:hypothetical protein
MLSWAKLVLGPRIDRWFLLGMAFLLGIEKFVHLIRWF